MEWLRVVVKYCSSSFYDLEHGKVNIKTILLDLIGSMLNWYCGSYREFSLDLVSFQSQSFWDQDT